MATAFTLCTGPVAGACSIGKGRVLVSVQADGVSCYDVVGQKSVASWALGGVAQEFSSAAVYDYDSNLCFAPVRPRGTSGGKGGSVLAWSADDTAGTITTLSHPVHLPPLHRIFQLSSAPEGEAEEAAAEEEEEAAAAQVDGSGQRRAGAVAVLASGGVALCGNGEVVAEVEEVRGQHTVAATFQPGTLSVADDVGSSSNGGRRKSRGRGAGSLVVVHSDPRSGSVSASAYRVAGGQVEATQPAVSLTPPAAGARAVAAASTPERTAVLWSDGTAAVYTVPGDRRPLGPAPGQPVGPGIPVAQRRLGGFRLPSGKQQQKASSGGKKRGASGEPDSAAGGVGMATIGDKQVAVVGWASSSEGATVLRLVVLETSGACVQLAQDFSASDVGLAVFDPSRPVQVESLGSGSGSNQLAICIGTGVLIATLNELKPPTLANLLGALALGKAAAALQRSSGGGGSGSGGTALLAPAAAGAAQPLLGSTAAVNPAALAAARVLHPDELAQLSAPFGGAARPMELRLELEAPSYPGQWLVPAKTVVWKVADKAADQRVTAEERQVWQEVQQPGSAALASDAALQQLLEPLLGLRQSTGLSLSPRLVSRLLMLAAEHEHWGAAAALVAAQPPSLLSDVPGLAAAAADAGKFELVDQLLLQSCEVPATELAALLRVLLSPPSTDAARDSRLARHSAVCAAAQAAAKAGQAAAAGGGQQRAEQPAAAAQQQRRRQQQQQQQHVPITPSRSTRRRRRKGAAPTAEPAGSDEEEEAEAAAAAVPAAEAVAAAADGEQQAGPAAEAAGAQQLEAAGARQAAVVACCSAAVEGMDPSVGCCLHPLVALRHRPGVLSEALRGLAAAQAVQLLRYLTALLRNLTTLVGNQLVGWQPPLELPPQVVLPRLLEVLAWANAALDANLMTLSLEPEAAPLLREMGQLVQAEVADTRPLLRLAGMVEHALLQRPLPQQSMATAKYSIQWLDLRIYPPEGPPEQQQQQRQ